MSASDQVAPRLRAQAAVTAQPEATDQYLAFTLRNEVFAVDILCIREIIEYTSLTEVPLMPPAVRGVINLRGAVVPVIDLSMRFSQRPTEVAKRTAIVIVETEQASGRQVLGMMVDAVNEVIDIPDSDIEPAPSFGANIHTQFIAGMAKVEERFLIVLDVMQVLSVDQLAQLAVVNH